MPETFYLSHHFILTKCYEAGIIIPILQKRKAGGLIRLTQGYTVNEKHGRI